MEVDMSLRLICHGSKALCDLLIQRSERGSCRAWLGAQYDIALFRELVLVHPGQDSEPTLHRITGNRFADGFRDGQTQATMIRLVVMLLIGHQIVHDDISATDFAPALQHGHKITMAFQPLHLDYAAVVMIDGIRRTGTCGPWRDGG